MFALALLGAMALPSAALAAPTVTATKEATTATGLGGSAQPGGTIDYKVTIKNTSGVETATGVSITDAAPAHTSDVAGTLKVSPLAFPDAYPAIKNNPLHVNATPSGLLVNDKGLPTPSAVANSGATSQAGTFTVFTDGSFDYTPPSPTFIGADTFTYTVTNTQLPNDTATVTITVANASPTITDTKPAAVTMDEDGSPTAFNLTLHATDADGDTITWSISSAASNGTATASGTGTSKVIGYTPTANYNGSDSFTVQVSDGNGGTDTIIVNVTINAVNDAPVLTAGATLNYTENQAATAIDTTITLTDVDSANMASATAQITGNYVNGQDILGFTTQNGITGSFNAANGTMTLSGSTTKANYVTALRSVTYFNNSNDPSALARTVTWIVNDGGATNNTSAPVTSTINVTAVNDPPTATGYTSLPAQAGIPITYPAGKLGGTDVESGTTVTVVTTPDSEVGGTVVINADGSFTFTPLPNTAGTNNTALFTYHVTDNGNPGPGVASASATVSFNVVGPAIYFVKNPAVGSGNCTLGNECLLATAVTNIGATTNTRIFIEDANSHTGPVPLQSSGWVVGQGVTTSFDTLFGISAPAGGGTLAARPATSQTNPTITTNGITLGGNNTIRGLTVSNTGNNTKIAGSAFGTLTVGSSSGADVTLSGTGKTLDLTNGTFAATSAFSSVASTATIAGATGHGLELNTVHGTAAFGSTSISNSAIQGIFVTATDANINFGNTSVSTNAAGEGIRLENNSGGQRTFGTLSITNSGGTAFLSSVGGLTVVGATTITNPTGIGINIVSTTASNGVSFGNTSVTQSGGTGVSLSNNLGAVTFADLDISPDSTVAGLLINNTAVGVPGTVTTTSGTISTLLANAVSIIGFNNTTNLQPLAMVFDSVSSTGGTNNVLLTNVSGNIDMKGGALSLSTGAAFKVSGSTATVSYAGSITNVTGGISLTNNTGGTINFTGGMSLATLTNPAFTATGGGTVSATQNNTSIVNTLTTTTGIALNVTSTTIGASGLTFRSISAGTGATGPSSGIILNNTGSSGGLTISGNGGTCSNAATCTGGAIQDTSSSGISLTNTQKVSIDRIFIQDTVKSGISGTQVVDFTITNSRIDNSGNTSGNDYSNLGFGVDNTVTENNLSGVVVITGNTLTNAFEHGVDIQNFAGTISNATISNNSITSSTSTATSKGSGIRLLGFGNASSTSNITKATIASNSIFNFPFGAGITAQFGNNSSGPPGAWGTVGSSTNRIFIQNNIIQGQSAANPMNTNAIIMTLTGKGQANWLADSNGTQAQPITNIGGAEIGVTVRGVSSTANCDITNNRIVGITNASAQGIAFAGDYLTATTDAPQLSGTIIGNNISGQDGEAIQVLATPGSSAHLDVSVKNNITTAPNCAGCNRFGITAEVGSSSATITGAPSMCLDMSGNTAAGSGVNPGIGIRKKTAAYVFNIEGFAGGGDPTAFLTAANPNGGGVIMISQTTGFGNCATAPLLLAPGGVQAIGTIASEALLSKAALDSTVIAALQRWEAADLTKEQVATLRSLSFEVADLPALKLGEADGNHIRISRNAGGNGWFISAGKDDMQFAKSVSATRSYTEPASAPAGRVDLLTAIVHEMGHALGLPDTYDEKDRDKVMYGFLTNGERRVPAAGDAFGAKPGDHAKPQFLAAPAVSDKYTIGDIPPGKTVVVTFQVQVENPLNPTNTTQISNQGTVSGTNFATVNGVSINNPNTDSDNPPAGTADPTITLLCGNPATVTTNTDAGAGSLRQALIDVCDGGEIKFSNTTAGGAVNFYDGNSHTINLLDANGELPIAKNVTITGPGANLLTVKRDAAAATNFRILHVQTGKTVTISGLTIANGSVTGGGFPAGLGGGIFNDHGVLAVSNCVLSGNAADSGGGIFNNGYPSGSSSTVVKGCTFSNNTASTGGGLYNYGDTGTATTDILNSTFTNNTATDGGAFDNYGSGATGNATLRIVNSTISGNKSNNDGGGIYNTNNASAAVAATTLTNVTITGNRADNDTSTVGAGGGIRAFSGTVTLKNTIVAGNFVGGSPSTTANDINGAVNADYSLIGNTNSAGITGANNQLNVDPLLGTLAINGGSTQTHLPGLGSAAINNGNNAALPADTFDLDNDANVAEALPVDQRGPGFPRISNTTVDIGAVETNYTITATAGTPQSTKVNTAFPVALQATVKESNTALNGVSVTFTPPASNVASGTFTGGTPATVSTNGSGVATAPTFTANAIAGGPYIVAASVTGLASTADFSLTNTPPTVTIDQASGQADPTAASPINFMVVFSDPVTGFGSSGVTISGTANPTTAVVTGSGTTYNVAVSGMTAQPGTVIATVNAGAATDGGGNANLASTSTDNTVTYDPPPSVTINQAPGQADPSNTSPINFKVVFSETVTGFGSGGVDLSGSGNPTTAVVTGSGTTYNVAVSGMSQGTVIASVKASAAIDSGSNPNTASTSTDNTVTYDTAQPVVMINQASGQADPTNASPINFTVVFSEAVTGFGSGSVSLSGTAGATTKVVTGSGNTYTVAVSGMTSDGTVIATVPAGGAVDTAGNTNAASTSADNTVTYDITKPDVTINQASGQADPTNASPINFTVVFTEAVTGFGPGSVTLSGTAGATTKVVTGSGTTYNVAVSGMTGNGTVIATVPAGGAADAAGNTNKVSTSTDNTVTYDGTKPSVTINQASGQVDPTNASPINFTVVFSEPVTGFGSGGVTLSGTAGAINKVVTGSGTTYNVAVSGMTSQGTIIASVAAGSAADTAGNTNTASTSTDNTVTYDNVQPSVTINQASGQADPTNASPINFTVVFSEPVTGFGPGSVTLSGTAGATTKVVTGSGTTYNVAVSGMTSNGTVIGTVPAGGAADAAGNTNTVSTSTDNSVTYDSTQPGVTINQAAAQSDPANASPINFTVVFSKPVTGFGSSGVTLSGTAGATTKVVTGSGATYNVAVSGMISDGTVIATVAAGSAADTANNTNTASTSTDNTVNYDTGKPSVTINQASGQVDPTNASPINFTVVFSEAVTGFGSGGVTLSGTAGAINKVVTGSGTTYNVAVSGMTSQGTVIATVAAGSAADTAGNTNTASTSTDNTVTYDNVQPSVTINQASGQSDPTNASPINFTVVFSEAVTGFGSGSVTLSGTAGATTKVVTGSSTTYNVAVSGMTSPGTVIATVPAGGAADAAGNTNTASASTDNTVTYDNVQPSVTINQASGQADPTTTSPINFTVVFSESVTGFSASGVTLSGTAGAAAKSVTGSGTTYNVAVSGMTSKGTVTATVPAGGAADAAGNTNTASTSTDNTVTFNTLATHFTVSAPNSAIPNSSFSFTVTALDQFNSAPTTYPGTVHFSSSDGAAILPVDGTLSGGSGTFNATLKTPGNQTITATDTGNSTITGTSNAIAVGKSSPTISTQASAGVNLGSGTISDSATLAGGASPTGSITFKLYGPNDGTCGNAPIFTSAAIPVSGNATYNSGNFTPTVSGTYRWIASYSGDSSNNAVTGACNDANESVIVSKANPAISGTVSPATGNLSTPFTDTATLSGGTSPTGTITFTVHGPNIDNCATPIFTSTRTVAGNANYTSDAFTPTLPGMYKFLAVYNGDTNNNSVATTCGAPSQTFVVNGPSPSPTPTPTATPAQALNISTRMRTELGDKAMIGGFIITGNASKSLVLRGLGPSLSSFKLNDLLLDPELELRGPSNNLIFKNKDWKDDQRALIEGTNFEPKDDRESVIVITLNAGAYTALLTGKDATEGIGLVEIYDTNPAAASELGNISTRGMVRTDDKVMIGGFTLGGPNNATRIAVRGRGPSLSQFNLSPLLANPVLELRNENGTIMVMNDDWQDDPVSAANLTANGLGLSDPKESGIFISLTPPGQFTAILSGKGGGIGIGLVEIYNLK
ncbi:MAG: large repetitive protein [Verrucomicrobiota bacterium]